MFTIKKDKKSDSIIYHFIGSFEEEDSLLLESAYKEDIQYTYTFIFDFTQLDFLHAKGIKILKKLYLLSIETSCIIKIENLQAQPRIMLEIYQIDILYNIQNTQGASS